MYPLLNSEFHFCFKFYFKAWLGSVSQIKKFLSMDIESAGEPSQLEISVIQGSVQFYRVIAGSGAGNPHILAPQGVLPHILGWEQPRLYMGVWAAGNRKPWLNRRMQWRKVTSTDFAHSHSRAAKALDTIPSKVQGRKEPPVGQALFFLFFSFFSVTIANILSDVSGQNCFTHQDLKIKHSLDWQKFGDHHKEFRLI